MLEPLATTVLNSLLSGRPLTGHTPALQPFRMTMKAASRTLPQDFFTPHPRRVKGKERASPGADPLCIDVTGLDSARASPPDVKRPSSLRSNPCRLRARRSSTRKTIIHAPVCPPIPSPRPFTSQNGLAQRRHVSSLPDSHAPSGSSSSECHRSRWRDAVQAFASASPRIDPEKAWVAYEELDLAEGCESLGIPSLLDFGSRVAAMVIESELDKIPTEWLELWGTRLTRFVERQGPRCRDESPLRWQCLKVSAMAMLGNLDDTAAGLRTLTSMPVGGRERHHLVHTYSTVASALWVHHSSESVLGLILEFWDALEPYLRPHVKLRGDFWGHVRTTQARINDIVSRVETPKLFLLHIRDRSPEARHLLGSVGAFLINAFCQNGMGLVAFDLLQYLRDVGLPTTFGHQLQVVKTLTKNESFEHANTLFMSLSQYMGTGAAVDSYHIVGLHLFAHQGDTARAQEYYARLVQRGHTDIRHEALVMHAHAVNGNPNRVTELFYHFFPPTAAPSAQTKSPNIYHYTTLIYAYAKKGDIAGMNAWLATMTKAGFQPDSHIYNIVLKCFAERGDLQYMAELLDKMRGAGVLPTRYSYGIIFTALAERRDAVAAEEIYKRAINDGIIPDRVMLTSLMHVYVQTGQWESVVRTFDYLSSSKRRGVRLTIEVFNTLLKAYVLIGAPFRVVADLFQKIEQSGLRPDARTFSLIIQSACDSQLMAIANDLLAEMERLSDNWQSRLNINMYVLTIIMAAHLRRGNRKKARKVFNQMRERGIKPSATTYATIIKEYTAEKSGAGLQVAQEFVRSLTAAVPEEQTWIEEGSSRTKALDTIYAPLLSAYAHRENPDAVRDLINDIEEVGGEQTLQNLTQLLDAHRRLGNAQEARALWPRIVELGVKYTQVNAFFADLAEDAQPDLRGHGIAMCIPLSIYIDAMSAAGLHADVAEAWGKLQKARLAFDSHNWNHLVVALVRAGEPERAFQVLEKVLIPYRRKLHASISRTRDQRPASPIGVLRVRHDPGDDDDGDADEADMPVMSTELSPNAARRRQVARTTTVSAGSDLENRPEDFAHSLHVLHQLSPLWNSWHPHNIVLIMLNDVLQHLSRGRLVQPVRPGAVQSEPFSTIEDLRGRRTRAVQILSSIYKTCPETVRAVEKYATQIKSPKAMELERRVQRGTY